jgi:hypothetical protein
MAYEIELAIFGAAFGLVTPISVYLAKKIIEPIFELRELISKIFYLLALYADVYSNPASTPKHLEVSGILRDHASQLGSKLILVKYPQVPAFLRLIPSKANVDLASMELIGISNMMLHGSSVVQIANSHRKIMKLLKL